MCNPTIFQLPAVATAYAMCARCAAHHRAGLQVHGLTFNPHPADSYSWSIGPRGMTFPHLPAGMCPNLFGVNWATRPPSQADTTNGCS